MLLKRPWFDWLLSVLIGAVAGLLDWWLCSKSLDIQAASGVAANVAAVVGGFSGVAIGLQRTGGRTRLFEEAFPGLLRRTWMHGIFGTLIAALVLILCAVPPPHPVVTGLFAGALALVGLVGLRIGRMLGQSLKLAEADDGERPLEIRRVDFTGSGTTPPSSVESQASMNLDPPHDLPPPS